jgi:hypothetical protein
VLWIRLVATAQTGDGATDAAYLITLYWSEQSGTKCNAQIDNIELSKEVKQSDVGALRAI